MTPDQRVKRATEALSKPPGPGKHHVSITMKLFYMGCGMTYEEGAAHFGITTADIRALLDSNPEYRAAWDEGEDLWNRMHAYWEACTEQELDGILLDMNSRLNAN